MLCAPQSWRTVGFMSPWAPCLWHAPLLFIDPTLRWQQQRLTVQTGTVSMSPRQKTGVPSLVHRGGDRKKTTTRVGRVFQQKSAPNNATFQDNLTQLRRIIPNLGNRGQLPQQREGLHKQRLCSLAVWDTLWRREGGRGSWTYTDPMNATSNQKASPWTSPEWSMWNLKGISILKRGEKIFHFNTLFTIPGHDKKKKQSAP